MKTMKVAFCNGEINNFHAKISVLIVIIVCWSSKYNVNPSIVWKIAGPNSLNYRLAQGGIFDGKIFFFPMKLENHQNQTLFLETDLKQKVYEETKKTAQSFDCLFTGTGAHHYQGITAIEGSLHVTRSLC